MTKLILIEFKEHAAQTTGSSLSDRVLNYYLLNIMFALVNINNLAPYMFDSINSTMVCEFTVSCEK